MDLSGKIAVVIGGSRGIGFGIARCLADAGAAVMIASQNEARAKKAAADVRREISSKVFAARTDVRSRADLENLLKKTLDKFGKVDILVNSAGVGTFSPAIELSEKDWDFVFEVNIKGTFLSCQIFSRQMISQGGGGKIINISSIGGKIGLMNRAHYCASKAAVDSFTRVLARELAPYNITVNAVCPGSVDTDMLKFVEEWMAKEKGITTEEVREQWLSTVPLGRVIDPIEIGKVVVFLASNASDAIVGQTINVDGGVAPY